MSIKDSVYTNPFALNAKYRNPRNPLGSLDEATETVAVSVNVAQPTASPTSGAGAGGEGGAGATGGGGGYGGGYGGGGLPCPATTEFVIVYAKGKIFAVPANRIRANIDRLYNPITKTAHLVVAAEIVPDQECVAVKSFDGAQTICSRPHPIITAFDDNIGTPAFEMPEKCVSVLGLTAKESLIESIKSAGRRDVVKISLADGFIYASGTDSEKFICGHNVKSSQLPE